MAAPFNAAKLCEPWKKWLEKISFSQADFVSHIIHGIGIFTYIWLIFFGKYTKNMDAMGMCPMFQVSAKGCWALYCGARMAEGCCVGHVLTVQAGSCLWGVFDENPGFELRTSEIFASSRTTKFSVVSTSTRFPQGRNVNVFYKQPFVIPCLDDKYVRAFIKNWPLGFLCHSISGSTRGRPVFFLGTTHHYFLQWQLGLDPCCLRSFLVSGYLALGL